MEPQETREGKLIAKFRKKIKTRKGTPFLDVAGGIFTPTTRKKVLGIVKQPEPRVSRNQFWYKMRNQVERALLDLQLFIEVAGKNNVNQVITQETLKPIVEALLFPYSMDGDLKPDLNRAEIAQLFIETGFSYLKSMKPENITLTHKDTIERAIDLSRYLVEMFKPEGKRRYSSYERVKKL